jgi:hypothetical protein
MFLLPRYLQFNSAKAELKHGNAKLYKNVYHFSNIEDNKAEWL